MLVSSRTVKKYAITFKKTKTSFMKYTYFKGIIKFDKLVKQELRGHCLGL